MRRATLLAWLLAVAPVPATPATAASLTCALGAADDGPRIEARLVAEDDAWRLTVLGESFVAAPVAGAGAGAAHFVVTPIDEAAEAVALFSIFRDGSAILTVHGDFLAAAAVTRTGRCTREAD